MSYTDELEEYDAELELRLKREYADVYPLFAFCVCTQEATYLCNRFQRELTPQASYPLCYNIILRFAMAMTTRRSLIFFLRHQRSEVSLKKALPSLPLWVVARQR